MIMPPQLTILSGPPGAGKTTYAIDNPNGVLVQRDTLRASLHGLDDEETLSHIMDEIARILLYEGRSVMVDAPNLEPWDRKMWETTARRCGAELRWVHLTTPEEVCAERVAARDAENDVVRPFPKVAA